MSSSFGKKQEGIAAKSFRAKSADLLIPFIMKTVIPLIPIAGVVFLAGLIINAEVTGTYEGQASGMGHLRLNLTEEDEQLSGELKMRRYDRYVIVAGKMLDDNKMELSLRKLQAGETVKTSHATRIADSEPAPFANTEASKEGAADESSKGREKDANAVGTMTIQARKDQNEIKGSLQTDGITTKFQASRGEFAAFLGKRWINRTLNYLGFKIKL